MITPSLDAIRANAARLGDRILRTPLWRWDPAGSDYPSPGAREILLKLELFQHTGTFKPRGAFSVMLALKPAQRARGVTTFSAGNHAIAVSYCAAKLGVSAKVVMPKTANKLRQDIVRRLGAELVLAEHVTDAHDRVKAIEAEEGRYFVHPFEDPNTVLGTGTLGLELAEQAGPLDAVIIPVGGGGLAAGMASAIKQLQPGCRVFGVEPEGADSMSRSFAAGSPQTLDTVRTIADSLAPPFALPLTFQLCREHLDRLVTVSDDQMRRVMALFFRDMKLAVEPAAAAAAAALFGPLRDELAGARVAVVVCGTNIDLATFVGHAGQFLKA